jgi:hypothetical protein
MKPAAKAAPPREAAVPALRIVVNVPDDVRPGTYSNFAQIKHGEHDFIIDFAFLTPPESPEHAAAVRKEGRLETKAVARIILPASVAPALVTALQTQIENWKAAIADGTPAGEKK